jgi:hypothetical protein
MTGASKFSAADSALGYLYQVRVALLWSLRRLKTENDFTVSLETLDDVSFQKQGGAPAELLQTKHHLKQKAALTDGSPDLWKSLRVWFEGYANKLIPIGTELHLVTTGTAPDGSIASYLRSDKGRDVHAALQRLETTASSSASKDLADAFAAFLAVTESVRKTLIDAVIVHDAASVITDIDDELREEIFFAVDRKHQDVFVERLEGWWLARSISQLATSDPKSYIQAVEIEAQMSDLREQFKQDSLPIDDDLLSFDLDESTQLQHANSVFVRQLELISAGKRRIAAAVRDYYRAFEQRSRWLRDDLVLVGDLSKYERRLIQEWELVFEGMGDDLGQGAAEDAKKEAARQVLKWAERVSLPIRPQVTEPFVTRGSLHMLADETRIGWHPDFLDRLSSLLGVAGNA